MADSQIDVRRNEGSTPARRGAPPPARFDPFRELHREMDRMLDRFWPGLAPFRRTMEPEAWSPTESGFAATPAIDFAEDEGAYHLTAELPGLSEKDVDVTVSGDTLSITGEKREERQEKDTNYHWSERRFGSFRRMLRLPENIDRDKIEANFKNGVLTIAMPKKAEARTSQKKIEVKAQP